MKNMSQTATDLLSMRPDAVSAERLNAMNVPEKEQNNLTAIMAAMIQAAAGGDVRAAVFVRDTIYENPTDKIRGMDLEKRYELADDRLDLDREIVEHLLANHGDD